MKKLLVVLVGGLFIGCDYTVPLVTNPTIEIDRSVLGLWQRPKEDGTTEQLLVLALDKQEYLVSYPSGTNDAMFARACLCRTAGKTLVQLKWLGNAQGEPPEDNRVYQFATYSVKGDTLTVRMLNTDVVQKDVASTKELAEAIAKNKDNPSLFHDSMVFTKVKK